MKGARRLYWGVLLLLILAPLPVRAQFQAKGRLSLSVETQKYQATTGEYILTNQSVRSCSQSLTLKPDQVADIEVSWVQDGLQLRARAPEKVISILFSGECRDASELKVWSTGNSFTEVLPFLILENTLIEGAFQRRGKAFFPSENDTLLIRGWDAEPVLISLERPRTEEVGGWTLLFPLAWGQAWEVRPDSTSESDLVTPASCHSPSQLFFLQTPSSACQGQSSFVFRTPQGGLMYGWKDSNTALPLPGSVK